MSPFFNNMKQYRHSISLALLGIACILIAQASLTGHVKVFFESVAGFSFIGALAMALVEVINDDRL